MWGDRCGGQGTLEGEGAYVTIRGEQVGGGREGGKDYTVVKW